MVLPFTLPDWVPPWVSFAIVSVAVLFLLAFLLMPFSVFGLKGRLESVEARLDEIQHEIRSLALRLPEPRRVDFEAEPVAPRRYEEAAPRPPIPPRAVPPDSPPPPPSSRVSPIRPVRSEPRLGPN